VNKFICIHGHFYQPPRENAWLEAIEQQESALPFHDWNERITAECYGPNAFSRILNKEGLISDIVNNYSNISFNFGPTLLDWLQKNAGEVYQEIIEADKLSQKKNNGHGAAIAQVYNHIIMPLASEQDKHTQIIWGIYDFEKRFKRKPEGMWLAETAVDIATLECLAHHQIKFTILAPRQAKAIKQMNEGIWSDVSGEKIDTTQAYLFKLPSGKSISLFFYNGNISQDVAFKGLLKDGKKFAEALCAPFLSDENAQLVHIATDGESYGHHHKHGDMALAYAIKQIQETKGVALTNYANFLAMFPPKSEVQIFENSSWSCEHGVERWRNNCGCNTGGQLDWNQQWRSPLRKSLDWLRDEIYLVYEKEMMPFCNDVWGIRNEYIHVILNRSEHFVDRFLMQYCKRQLNTSERTKVIRLLEMQRQTLLMFTSCGWFFDEVSGIETIQILQYAERAIQLAESECNIKLETEFIAKLALAESNLSKYGNAAELFKMEVIPSKLTLGKVGVHYAVASLFEEYPEALVICNYKAESEIFERLEAGVLKLAIGKTKVYSLITFSEKEFYFAVLYLGQNHIIGNYANTMPSEKFELMRFEITNAFNQSRVADVIGVMQSYFGPEKFSLNSLLKDEQRKILEQIIQKDINQTEDSYKKIYNRNYNSMTVLKNAALPIPSILMLNLETVLNNEIRNFFKSSILYPARLEKLANEVHLWEVKLDKESISFVAELKLFSLVQELQTKYSDIKFVKMIVRLLNLLNKLEVELVLSKLQNEYFKLARKLFYNTEQTCVVKSNSDAEWISPFKELGKKLSVKVIED
jgi:alpha-amylase/alpha-mannosidase (GH57 family)